MQFSYYLPLWGILLCIVISVSITVYGYLRIGQPLQNTVRNILIALRFCAITILLGCLLAPVIIEKKDITPPTNLSILVDTSLSMQMEDNYSGTSDQSRLDQVKHILNEETHQFISTLSSDYKVHIYNFDTKTHTDSVDTLDFSPQGLLTDIISSIRDVVSLWKGQQNAGVVLISDGAHNASNINVEEIADLDTPIYTIGVGSAVPPKDLRISKVDVLPVAHIGHESIVGITITHSGYENESVRVALRRVASNNFEGNQLVDATILDISEDTAIQGQRITDTKQHYVELKLTPEKEGNYQYSVTIPSLEGELTYANNEKTFSLKVVKAKLNVLYFEGRPRWEYAFLKRTLERDPDIDATVVMKTHKVDPETVLSQNSGYYPIESTRRTVRFPESIEELRQYDVLILGDLSEQHLTKTQQQAISTYVIEHSKSVIFLPSKTALGRGGFNLTSFADILPIQIPNNGCNEQEGEFTVAPTQAGLFHPILQLDDSYERNTEMWQNLPVLTISFSGYQQKAGATTLLNKHDGSPVLLFQRVGLGKSLLFTAEGLWNWRFGVNSYKDSKYKTVYQRFWAQTIRWMAQESEDKTVYISTDASSYAQYDEVDIQVRTFLQTYQSQDRIDIQLEITSPSGTTFPLKTRSGKIESQSSNVGHHSAKLKLDENGRYKIRAVAMRENRMLDEDEINISVHQQLIEMESPQLNETLLKEIAQQTGGVYLNIDSIDNLHKHIKTVEKPVFVDTQRDLWTNPLLLIIIVGLLGSEWIIRKRVGLV